MTNPYTAPPAQPPTPRWARKRYVLPALALALFIGMGVGNSDGDKTTDAKPTSATPQPTVTVTTTATETAVPKPAGTVTATATTTATATVKVKVTKTVTAQADAGAANEGVAEDDSAGDGSASVYYENCTAARAAGAAPVHRGDPGYGRHLDRDGDGVGCE